MTQEIPDFRYTELDCKIWEEKLEKFVPHRIFDAHTHFWSNRFVTPETRCDNDWLEHQTDGELLLRVSQMLYPGRTVDFLTFSMPVIGADCEHLNPWVAAEVKKLSPHSLAAMLITPDMPGEMIRTMVKTYGFAALKPYHLFAAPGRIRIRDYFTSGQMEAADEGKLAVVLHCRSGVAADIAELEECAARYPGIRWILAHCGAAFNPDFLEPVVRRLADMPGIWFDTSGICEVYPQALLLKHVSRKRIFFGSDIALGSGGCRRGRVVSLANSVLWYKNPERTTFWVYEQLLAMRRACDLMELTGAEVEDIFFRNAADFFRPEG